MDVPALLSQHADQFGDELIVAGSCRVGNGIANDRDLSPGSSGGMSGGSGHICLGTAGDVRSPLHERGTILTRSSSRRDLQSRKIVPRFSGYAIINAGRMVGLI